MPAERSIRLLLTYEESRFWESVASASGCDLQQLIRKCMFAWATMNWGEISGLFTEIQGTTLDEPAGKVGPYDALADELVAALRSNLSHEAIVQLLAEKSMLRLQKERKKKTSTIKGSASLH